MSRLGNKPIAIPEGVDVLLGENNHITVKGPLGVLKRTVVPNIALAIEDKTLVVRSQDKDAKGLMMHGLSRMLLHNMVVGVTKGYQKTLELIGVGYRAEVTDGVLSLSVGKSHDTYFKLPPEISMVVETPKGKISMSYLHVKGIDKQLVGQVAAKIREQKPPEAYISNRTNTQKGIRYVDEPFKGKSKKEGK